MINHSSDFRAKKRSRLINPFRTPVPFWEQITWNYNGLSLDRDCGTKGVKVSIAATGTAAWLGDATMVVASAMQDESVVRYGSVDPFRTPAPFWG